LTKVIIDARRSRPGLLEPPVSKSDALRTLVLRQALGLPPADDLLGPRPWPTDVEVVSQGLALLRPGTDSELDCRDGGAPLRFLLAQAAITPCVARFTGSARLGQRPHAPLIAALRESLGASGLSIVEGNPWPLVVRGTGSTGAPRFCVSGDRSSQYATSLLLAAAALSHREGRPWCVDVEGELASPGYLDLTLHHLAGAGVKVTRSGAAFEVSAVAPHDERRPLPRDWSSLGYLLVMAWKTHSRVAGLDIHAVHPDRVVLEHLARVGLKPQIGGKYAEIAGNPCAGLRVSGLASPDLIPTLVALACVLPGPSLFTDLAVLRDKESDRLAAVCELAAAGGATTALADDTLTVVPGERKPRRLDFDARGDHRLTLASATLAVCLEAVLELSEAQGVEKSFPRFFEVLRAIGVSATPALRPS
jgi:3-phosphoshikimate 1-carboxyvinyltransferase